MDEKRGKSGCPKSSRPACSLTRREFLSTSSKLVAGSVLAATVGMTPGKAWGSTLALPSWKSPTAKSDIFVVKDIPAPRYSLAGGTLPPGPSDLILRDAGIEALAALMDRQGTPFFGPPVHRRAWWPATAWWSLRSTSNGSGQVLIQAQAG